MPSWARVIANTLGPANSSTRIPSSTPPVMNRKPLASSGGIDTMMKRLAR